MDSCAATNQSSVTVKNSLNDIRMSKMSTEHFDNPSVVWYTFYRAIQKDDWDTVEFILNQGINFECRRIRNSRIGPLIHAAQFNSLTVVRGLLQRDGIVASMTPTCPSSDNTALHEAAKMGRTEVINVLLEFGASIETLGDYRKTALHLAVKFQQEDSFKLLLERGADLNARDVHGATPLHVAVEANSPEMVKALLLKGAEVNAVTTLTRRTPLEYAVENNSDDITRILLRHSADIHRTDEKGRNILHCAVLHAGPKIIRRILNIKLDLINQIDEHGKTPLEYAGEKFVDLFIEIVGKCIALDIHILKKNIEHLIAVKKDSFNTTVKNCTSEVKRMRTTEILDGYRVTVLDILTNPFERVLVKLRSIKMRSALKNMSIKTSFPIYSAYIIRRIKFATEKIELFEKNRRIINIVLNDYNLPDSCLENINSWFSESDAKQTVKSFNI